MLTEPTIGTRPCPVCGGARSMLFLLLREVTNNHGIEMANVDEKGNYLPFGKLQIECVDCGTTGQVALRDPATLAPSSNLAPLQAPK